MSFENRQSNDSESTAENHETPIEYMTVFRVRHGDTEYREQFKGEMHDDLTELGKEQIRLSAESIRRRIDPERDIVWVISSPRIRTLDSKKIIEDTLQASGVEIWDGTRVTKRGGKHEAIFERIRNFDFLTDGNGVEAEVVSTDDSRYPEIFKKVVSDLESESSGVAASQQAHLSEHPQLEKSVDRVSRTRNQLTYLMRIARTIQPKLNKRIVIIQAEHTESIDDLIENATRGIRTEKKMTGISKGGIVEVHFPTDQKSNEIDVIFPDSHDEHYTIGYDPDKRIFDTLQS
jgi:bisphosphoglycerate-dependent phosphoglycerate mutase